MKTIILTILVILPVIFAEKQIETQHLFLRHNIFSTLSNLATPTNAMTSLQTCKNVGSTWNSLTGSVDSVKGTWQGTQCNSKCQAQKGIVCGNVLKDCCAMECQGSFYKSCKFDLRLTRQMMQCGV